MEPDRLGQRRQPRSSSAEAPSSSWASMRERGRPSLGFATENFQGRASGGGEVRRVRTARPRICRTAPTRASVVRRAFRGFKLSRCAAAPWTIPYKGRDGQASRPGGLRDDTLVICSKYVQKQDNDESIGRNGRMFLFRDVSRPQSALAVDSDRLGWAAPRCQHEARDAAEIAREVSRATDLNI